MEGLPSLLPPFPRGSGSNQPPHKFLTERGSWPGMRKGGEGTNHSRWRPSWGVSVALTCAWAAEISGVSGGTTAVPMGQHRVTSPALSHHQPSTVTSPGQPHPVTSPAPSHRSLCGETSRRQQISAVPALAKPQHIRPPYLHTKLALSFKLERGN